MQPLGVRSSIVSYQYPDCIFYGVITLLCREEWESGPQTFGLIVEFICVKFQLKDETKDEFLIKTIN